MHAAGQGQDGGGDYALGREWESAMAQADQSTGPVPHPAPLHHRAAQPPLLQVLHNFCRNLCVRLFVLGLKSLPTPTICAPVKGAASCMLFFLMTACTAAQTTLRLHRCCCHEGMQRVSGQVYLHCSIAYCSYCLPGSGAHASQAGNLHVRVTPWCKTRQQLMGS